MEQCLFYFVYGSIPSKSEKFKITFKQYKNKKEIRIHHKVETFHDYHYDSETCTVQYTEWKKKLNKKPVDYYVVANFDAPHIKAP